MTLVSSLAGDVSSTETMTLLDTVKALGKTNDRLSQLVAQVESVEERARSWEAEAGRLRDQVDELERQRIYLESRVDRLDDRMDEI